MQDGHNFTNNIEYNQLVQQGNIPAKNKEWRNINWQLMNFESQDDQQILFVPEPLSSIYPYKEDAVDKITNHNMSQIHKVPYFTHAFEISPRRGSFFFTPNSPKPPQFELVSSIDSSYPKHSAIYHSAPNKASICNKINLEEDFEEVEEHDSNSCPQPSKKGCPNRSSKNAKGLRNLSQNVYMIVSQLSITKYKEVADRLISSITMDQSVSGKRKDEHNVKRRVYDALNVLIAAGLLRKEGKEVVCNDSYHKESSRGSDPCQLRQKQKLQEQLHNKLKDIAQKQQKLQKLQKKKNLIEYIINRNKQQKPNEVQVLRFPLIGIITDINTTYQHFQKNILIMRMNQKPKLHGDVDLLLQINKDKIQMQNLLKNICCNIQKQDVELKMQEQ